MANPTIRARLILDTSGYTKGTQEAKKATGTFSQIRNTMVGVFGGNLMTSAVGKAKDFFTGAITGAMNAQEATDRFAQTMSNLGFAQAIPQATTFIASLSKQAAIAKGPLRSSFETLLRSTHNVGEAQRATTLATNIAAGSGKDLGAVSLALAKAYNGSTTGLQRLGIKVSGIVPNLKAQQAAQKGVQTSTEAYLVAVQKYGPHSDQATKAANKLHDAQGKLAEAQKETKKQALPLNQVMANLSKTFAGQAAKSADSTAGRMRAAKLQFQQFQITIGQVLLPAVTALLGVFNQFMPVLQAFANWAKANPTALKIIAGVIIALVVAWKAWSAAMAIQAAITSESAAATWALTSALLANPITWIVVAVVALIAALVILQLKFNILGIAVKAVWAALQWAWNMIVAGATWVLNFFRKNWMLILGILLGPIALAAALIFKYWDQVKAAAGVFVRFLIAVFNTLKGPFVAVFNFLVGVWNGFMAFLRGAVGVVRAVASAIGNAFGVIGNIIGSIIGGARNIISGFVSFISGVIGTVGRVAGNIANAIKAPVNAIIGGLNAIHVSIGPWTLPSVSLPKFLGGGTLGGNTIGPWTFGFPHITPLATGGLVLSEGLFHLHAGEAVTPAPLVGRNTPLVSIEKAYFGSDMDVDQFMDRVAWNMARVTP